VGPPEREESEGGVVDNGTCFIAKEFKAFCKEQGVRVISGRPYNPRGRGKLERFHGTLFQELISQVRFHPLSHFRRELWLYRRRYNRPRSTTTEGS
jgi:transposase InsO family protein